MKKEDFKKYKINHFSASEIKKTGAELDNIHLPLMLSFNNLRIFLNRKVKLIYNGLTTGNHKSKEHPGGFAGDFYLDPKQGSVNIQWMDNCMLKAGFKGRGFYFNKETGLYTFHCDTGEFSGFRSWGYYKFKRKDSWIKIKPGILKDPRSFVL